MPDGATCQIPILRTQRLTLRAIRADDHADLFALAINPDVARYMHEGATPSAGDVWNRMTAASGQWVLRGYGMLAVDDDDGFAGRIGFHHPYGIPAPLLVYALSPRTWGRGYAVEGARAALDWLYASQGSRRVVANIDLRNVGSRRVAEKMGAKRGGTTRTAAGHVLGIWDFSRDVDSTASG